MSYCGNTLQSFNWFVIFVYIIILNKFFIFIELYLGKKIVCDPKLMSPSHKYLFPWIQTKKSINQIVLTRFN